MHIFHSIVRSNHFIPVFYMKKLILIFTLSQIFFAIDLSAQNTSYPLYNEQAYNIVDRFDVLYGNKYHLHTDQKGYIRKDVVKFIMDADSSHQLSARDKEDVKYILTDNPDYIRHNPDDDEVTTLTGKRVSEYVSQDTLAKSHSFFGQFYRRPADLWFLDTKYFDLRINPVLDFQIGKDTKGTDGIIFANTRGITLQGSIDDRIFFYSDLLETQARYPTFVSDYVKKYGAVPGTSFFKGYQSNIFKIADGYDFTTAQAYIGFNVTKHVNVQFGHGQHFLGDGIRSLFLSNFSGNYFFMRLNTNVWKFQYQNIFAELNASNAASANNDIVAKKYITMHHLSYNVTPNFTVGLFEGIVFQRNRQFELQYLNPVILYRVVEYGLGSPDNIVLGLNSKWNIKNRFSLYGQFLLDEFVFKELITDNKGWWGNKYSLQLGAKYMNAFNVDHLDAQVEYNVVRPYTYTHFDSLTNYSHNSQPLAHPLGANFQEYIFRLHYQPTYRLTIEGRIMTANVGEDTADKNYGNNILLNYNTRLAEYGNYVGQGVHANITTVSLDASWQLYHNMFLNFQTYARKKSSDDPTRDQSTFYVGGGLRVNFATLRPQF